MELIIKVLNNIWSVTVEMAPYLLFGFLMAGMLSALISKDYVRRHLGGRGLSNLFKAALVGVPMPICSCGVIPLAASLRKHGASRGATASFLASTPQTGVDSLLITYALLGWVFAVFRAAVAFLSGILCGAAVTAVSPRHEEPLPDCTSACCQNNRTHLIRNMFTYGFVDLPRSIARSMLLGIIVAGIIGGLIPDGFFEGLGDSPWTMLIMLLIGIPLYVCSTGSVPIALAFVKAGISPGAALIFLITGPATNAATLTTLWGIIGKRQLVVFLIVLSICALGAGFFMNTLNLTLPIAEATHHHASGPGIFSIVSAGVLIGILLFGLLPDRSKKN